MITLTVIVLLGLHDWWKTRIAYFIDRKPAFCNHESFLLNFNELGKTILGCFKSVPISIILKNHCIILVCCCERTYGVYLNTIYLSIKYVCLPSSETWFDNFANKLCLKIVLQYHFSTKIVKVFWKILVKSFVVLY